MAFAVQCASCGAQFSLPDTVNEQRMRDEAANLTCARCGTLIRFPQSTGDGAEARGAGAEDVAGGRISSRVPRPEEMRARAVVVGARGSTAGRGMKATMVGVAPPPATAGQAFHTRAGEPSNPSQPSQEPRREPPKRPPPFQRGGTMLGLMPPGGAMAEPPRPVLAYDPDSLESGSAPGGSSVPNDAPEGADAVSMLSVPELLGVELESIPPASSALGEVPVASVTWSVVPEASVPHEEPAKHPNAAPEAARPFAADTPRPGPAPIPSPDTGRLPSEATLPAPAKRGHALLWLFVVVLFTGTLGVVLVPMLLPRSSLGAALRSVPPFSELPVLVGRSTGDPIRAPEPPGEDPGARGDGANVEAEVHDPPAKGASDEATVEGNIDEGGAAVPAGSAAALEAESEGETKPGEVAATDDTAPHDESEGSGAQDDARRAVDPESGEADEIPEGVDEPRLVHLTEIALKRAEKCHFGGRATGTANVLMTFGPDGRVEHAKIEGEPIASAPVANCVLIHARSIVIKPYEGPPFTLQRSIILD